MNRISLGEGRTLSGWHYWLSQLITQDHIYPATDLQQSIFNLSAEFHSQIKFHSLRRTVTASSPLPLGHFFHLVGCSWDNSAEVRLLSRINHAGKNSNNRNNWGILEEAKYFNYFLEITFPSANTLPPLLAWLATAYPNVDMPSVFIKWRTAPQLGKAKRLAKGNRQLQRAAAFRNDSKFRPFQRLPVGVTLSYCFNTRQVTLKADYAWLNSNGQQL